jgi:hypothetical protein
MGKTLADLEKEMNQEFFIAEKNTAEVRNNTKKPVFVTAVRGAVSDRIYIYIHKDEGFEVKPNNYRLIPIEKEKLATNNQSSTKGDKQ